MCPLADAPSGIMNSPGYCLHLQQCHSQRALSHVCVDLKIVPSQMEAMYPRDSGQHTDKSTNAKEEKFADGFRVLRHVIDGRSASGNL